MNARQRYLETLLFGKPDHVPFFAGAPRESTLRAWHAQGLPEGTSWEEELERLLGIEVIPRQRGAGVRFHTQMIPEFDEAVLSETEGTLIVRDWKGNVCEISKDYDVSYLRSAKDFVTRRWISCPVERWDDWESMKSRYDPDDPSRVPEDVPALGRQLAGRDYPVCLRFDGPFWQMREWLGFESLCMRFLDDPDLIRDMCLFWTEYICVLLEKVLPFVEVDSVLISEDMAYKEKAMISPEMTREFLGPCYRAWNEIIKGSGCPLFMVDSDGFVGGLIPVWIECGINVCEPMEIAAGNDIGELRARFGRGIAFRGGVDKRAIAKGGAVIEAELERLRPVVEEGGYWPCCDHGVPPDISWPRFVDYSRRLARLCGL